MIGARAALLRCGLPACVPSAPASERRNSGRRQYDGGRGSVAVNGSGRPTLVAMVQARELPAQDGQLMPQRDEFELQRCAAAQPEREQGTDSRQEHEHAYAGMTAALKTLCFSAFWSFEQAQAGKLASAAHGYPGTRQNDNIPTVSRGHLGNVG